MWLALTRLEKQVQDSLPDLAEATARAKERLYAALDQKMQQGVTKEITSDNAPEQSFDEQVEAAEKQSDPGRRDQQLSFAVTRASKDVPIDKVLGTIDKISEAGIRDPLLNWYYYFSAQALIASKELSEARKMAARVTELDQRAYLFTRIAEESLKQTEDQAEARDLLNEISNAISKAPKTIVTARALLALAYLYAKIDVNRGVEELGNAVKTINSLESPDFSQEYVIMKIEGKTFGSFASFSTPGFNPENAFREMGKLDFDGSLIQATTFTDKSLRALTTLAVIEPCFVTKAKKKT
jgi:biopolymer transport protein ExbD